MGNKKKGRPTPKQKQQRAKTVTGGMVSAKKRVAGKSPMGGAEAMKTIGDLLGGIAKISDNPQKPSVVQKMTSPPENVIQHLVRVQAPFWVAEVAIGEDGEVYPHPCLVVPYENLIVAELSFENPEIGKNVIEGKAEEAKFLTDRATMKRVLENRKPPEMIIDGPEVERVADGPSRPCCPSNLGKPHIQGCRFEPREDEPIDYSGPVQVEAPIGSDDNEYNLGKIQG